QTGRTATTTADTTKTKISAASVDECDAPQIASASQPAPYTAAAASRIPSSLEEKRAHRAASTSRSRARPSSRTQAMKTPKSTAASVFAQARGRETEERPRRRKDVRAGATVPRTSFGLAG